ncbi:MAG: IS481 family transposase [Ilumatobacteraceae bacterium]|nr:IS481 family transposase [Ilumatobacteraceae bacterium]
MGHARTQHPNASLTPLGRRKMIACVIDRGWTIEATAERFQVDAKTVRKWRDRFVAEGSSGLLDRSSRPHRSPSATPDDCRRRIIELRQQHRWGAAHIGFEVGRASSTVQKILIAEGLGRLDSGDRATKDSVVRYQRDRPGELVHVDVKKLAGIPDGGGWRIHGKGNAPTAKRSTTGYRFLHSALDDRTRLVYSEIHANEQAVTAVAFWHRANTWFNAHGITVERVLTDNGSCYKSHLWRDTLLAAGITPKRTRPFRPQTNGKIERFHRILLEEWAYIRDWHSDDERSVEYDHFVHFYNHHRAHGALGWSTPIDTLKDNVPVMHT